MEDMIGHDPPELALDNVAARYPLALEWFDYQCGHLGSLVRFDETFMASGKTRLRAIAVGAPSVRALWYPDAQVWARYSRGVKSTPRRHPRTYERELGHVVIERYFKGVVEWHVAVRCARCSARIRPSEACALGGNAEKEWVYCEPCATAWSGLVEIREWIPPVPASEALKLIASSLAPRYPGRSR